MSGHKFRQLFGASRFYPGAGVEFRFPAPADRVALAPLAEICRGLRRWDETLPTHLPAEEAIGRAGETFLKTHVSAWSRFRRDDVTGVVALGTFAPAFVIALLGALERMLLGSPAERAGASQRLATLATALERERPINWSLMDAARTRAIEAHWVVPGTQLFQLGLGARGRQFCQLTNQADSATGWIVAKSKHSTIEMLRAFGFPTTRAALARNEADVPAVIERIGFPCVTKPLRLGKGRGITTHITGRADLEAGIRHALRAGGAPVLVEDHVEGIDHRILVAGGEMLWAYSKVPAAVTGDGRSTVRALIERENLRRTQSKGGALIVLEQIRPDGELARFLSRRYGIGLEDVVPGGAEIELAGQSNISLGGIVSDVTADVHPDNRELAMDIARAMRMSVLGIDFITADISRSWREGGCAVIEVNGTPGLSGKGDAALAVRSLFPYQRSGQIPTFAAIGSEPFRAQAVDALLAGTRRAGARATSVDWRLGAKDPQPLRERPLALSAALLDTSVDAIVLSCDSEAIEEKGFPLLRADLVVAEDVSAFAFLSAVADELCLAPKIAAELTDKAAAIVATHAAPTERRHNPTLTLHARVEPSQPFTIECLRFRALPRAWFYRELGLPAPAKNGMVEYADVFSAVTRLADAALEKAGHAPLPHGAEFFAPAAGWDTLAVVGRIAAGRGAAEATASALGAAIDVINLLLGQGPTRPSRPGGDAALHATIDAPNPKARR